MKNNINNMKTLFLEKEKEIFILKKKLKKKYQLISDRIKKDISNTYKYSLSNLILQLLPDIDNLEKAILLSKKENSNFNDIVKELNVILKLFLNLFKVYNITAIDDINIPFDPLIHQAIVLSDLKNMKSNYVVEVMQKGYKIYDRLLRPAMVSVSK